MDIYILRDGKELGPFSTHTTQTLLSQGSVAATDLAWRPGMPQWLPLPDVLALASAAHAATTPPPADSPDRPPATPPPAPSAPAAETKPAPPTDGEPATGRQKAFLTYMGVDYPANATRQQAALLVSDAIERPKDPARLGKWVTDRLKLHPDLFEEEIKEQKVARVDRYFEKCQTHGAEFFEKVSKAHVQVLVGYLDVRYPHWDSREESALEDYFYPAIAEKFPQLVKRGHKGRFKFPDSRRVAPELAQKSDQRRSSRGRSSAVQAAVRGAVFGAAILGVLYLGYRLTDGFSKGTGASQQTASQGTPAPLPPPTLSLPEIPPPEPTLAEATPNDPPIELPPLPPEPGTIPTDPTDASATVAAPAPEPSPEMSEEMKTAGDTPAPVPAEGASPEPAMKAEPALSADAPATPPAPDPSKPVVHPPGTQLRITKALEVELRFGRARLIAGTPVALVSQDGQNVRVRYGSDVVQIPAASTDIASLPPPPDPALAGLEMTAPTISSVGVAPVAPAPTATPPTRAATPAPAPIRATPAPPMKKRSPLDDF